MHYDIGAARHARREELLRRARDAEALAAECEQPLAKQLCFYMANSWRRMAEELSAAVPHRTTAIH